MSADSTEPREPKYINPVGWHQPEPGLYWFSGKLAGSSTTKPVLLEIGGKERTLRGQLVGYDQTFSIELFDGEWYGPLDASPGFGD